MENIEKVLVVADEDGNLRPMAGIWKDNELGNASALDYLAKASLEDVVVKATLIEGKAEYKKDEKCWVINGVWYCLA